VIFALGKIGDLRAVKPISAMTANLTLKELACQSLSEISYAGSAQAIVPMLANEVLSGPREIPNKIVQCLQAIGAPAVTSLISGLKDKNDSIREGSAMALWKIKDARTIAPLITCLSDKSPSVRAAAALALGTQQDPTAIKKLAPLMKDNNASVRDCTAIALAELGDARAAKQIIEFVDARTGYNLSPLRIFAIKALGKIKEQQAIGTILSTFRYWRVEDSRELRIATVEALTAITGQKFGHNYHRWLAWGDAEGKWHPSSTNHIHNPLDK
jgi:HEAT repeat protein